MPFWVPNSGRLNFHNFLKLMRCSASLVGSLRLQLGQDLQERCSEYVIVYSTVVYYSVSIWFGAVYISWCQQRRKRSLLATCSQDSPSPSRKLKPRVTSNLMLQLRFSFRGWVVDTDFAGLGSNIIAAKCPSSLFAMCTEGVGLR